MYSQTKIDIIARKTVWGVAWSPVLTKVLRIFKHSKKRLAISRQKAWANVESFRAPDPTLGSGYFLPANIDTLKQQIAVVSPSVSNIITWLYHTSLDTLPEHAQLPTPAIGALRQKLNQDYISAYISTGTGKVGDLNKDGKVDINDYNLLLSNFGKSGTNIVGI